MRRRNRGPRFVPWPARGRTRHAFVDHVAGCPGRLQGPIGASPDSPEIVSRAVSSSSLLVAEPRQNARLPTRSVTANSRSDTWPAAAWRSTAQSPNGRSARSPSAAATASFRAACPAARRWQPSRDEIALHQASTGGGHAVGRTLRAAGLRPSIDDRVSSSIGRRTRCTTRGSLLRAPSTEPKKRTSLDRRRRLLEAMGHE